MERKITPIAYIRTDFPEKFGVPRQSGTTGLAGRIIFYPPYNTPAAVKGLEGFSHLWLIFDFSKAHRDGFNATVRPPRLGGNRRMGVFATRSPFRPNSLGLSSVRLTGIASTENGTELLVDGIDIVDGTPIFDIKPYVPASDCHPDAKGGFADEVNVYSLDVRSPDELLSKIQPDKRAALLNCLAQDPRPSYHDDGREYTFSFADSEVTFCVSGNVLTVLAIEKR